jgi:sulfate adenylyltransferase subunit 2
VFPLSNWTELDVWRYIARERIALPSLYFARTRPTVQRHGMLIVADDGRLPLAPDEKIEMREVRFRTLGCYPLTGAVESKAATIDAIIDELASSRRSERQGRMIDRDAGSSMEQKKREGYF